MKKVYIIILLLLAGIGLHAQVLVKGTVYEAGSGIKIPDVFVKDMSNKQIAISDDAGKFGIKTETGHLLIFSAPNYVADTLYVTDLNPKRVELKTITISLREVNITAKRLAFDPHKEYPDVYEKSKVYPLSPSSWFGKDARNARRLKRYFVHEQQERHVDEVFTRGYVSSIIPLKDDDLENFMTMYRPTYAFITSNNRESLAVYINDSYKKYMALPPEKRKLQPLTSQ